MGQLSHAYGCHRDFAQEVYLRALGLWEVEKGGVRGEDGRLSAEEEEAIIDAMPPDKVPL